MSASLSEVAVAVGAGIAHLPDRTAGLEIESVTHDSRAVGPGALFCCVPGARADGHAFAAAAVTAGARALLVDRVLTLDVPQLVVNDVRWAMGPAASVVYGHPSQRTTVVGVTGTNGKTSTVELLAGIWRQAGERAEVYGTLTGARTTPEAPDLQRQLRDSVDRRMAMVAMEVSSHALELGRVAGTRFAAAVFTNLGRDHLDFHGDMASYFRAKARLFEPSYTELAVVNVDDDHGRRLARDLADRTAVAVLHYSLDQAVGLELDGPTARFEWRGEPVTLQLPGRHNVANALAAATTAAALGVAVEDIVDGLQAAVPVRGRFELIDAGQPFRIAVDYAHTPDALTAVLAAAREVAGSGRVILVFGCGGDRDHDKRPEMGRAAQDGADLVFVTSDNPRSEDPEAILTAVVAGMDTGRGGVRVEVDRRSAIAGAVRSARPGDLVLLAGKGHETEQVIGDVSLPFDDRAVALEELKALP